MKKIVATLIGSSLLTAGAISLSASGANAATFACSSSIAGNVSGATGCEVSNTATQDFLNSSLTVNQEEFFGFTDWEFSDKLEANDDDELNSSSWNLSSVLPSSWSNAMLIFKSGRNTFLTGYSFDSTSDVSNVSWTNPFDKDVSHVSLYYRAGDGNDDAKDIPEPSAALGLGLLLGGMALSRRRKS